MFIHAIEGHHPKIQKVVIMTGSPSSNPSRRRNNTQNPPDADRLGLRCARDTKRKTPQHPP
jgi:hypothetical protein